MEIFAAAALAVAWELGDFTALGHGAVLPESGFYWSIALWVRLPAEIGLVLAFAALRRGPSLKEYFALTLPTRRQMLQWSGGLVGFVALSDGLTWYLGRPLVPDVIVDAYFTSLYPPLLFAAMVVAAPIAEEAVFRGFVFRGLQHSALGPVGSILITTVAWAALHYHYDWYGRATVLAGGLMLGFARWRTGSLIVPWFLHAMMNTIATFELIMVV
jgi:membrane protease YdiL (CAAX protease family)